MIYFSADHHFLHHNILKYALRPFRDLNHMHDVLIDRHNSLVKNEDVVYILGDISLTPTENKNKLRRLINKMNGQKHLILGNHDEFKPFAYIDIGFISVHTSLEVDEYILVHDPSVAGVFLDRKFLCGHVHQLFLQCGNAYNVGVDVHDYYPISIDEIKRRFKIESKS